MPNASIRRSIVGPLVIVALAVTAWSAVAQAGPTVTPTATPTATPTPTNGGYCEIDIKCSVNGEPPRDDFCIVVPVADVTFYYDFIGGEAEIFDDQFGVIGIYTGTTLTRTETISESVLHTATFRPIDTLCLTGIFSDSVAVVHGAPTPTATPTATPTPTNDRCMNANLCEPIPCPSTNSCGRDSDCATGEICVDPPYPSCIPGGCFCGDTGNWICTGDCSNQCAAVPTSDCLCEVEDINPNLVVLQNVGTGGKGSSTTRKMVMILHAVDAPGATCDPGEFSVPTPVNLRMEDDRGNILIDSAKTVVCKQGATTLKRSVFFQGPLNCENGAVPLPKPGFSLGSITSTGSAPGTADYVESTKIKCFE